MLSHPYRFIRFHTHSSLDSSYKHYIATETYYTKLAIDKLNSIDAYGDLEYWIFGINETFNHLQPEFLDSTKTMRFHLVCSLYRTIIPRHMGQLELIYEKTISPILREYKHPVYNWRYYLWGFNMPSYDLDGWSELNITALNEEYKRSLIDFKPSPMDLEFTNHIWDVVYDCIQRINIPVVLVNLNSYITDPPHRNNLPELALMANRLIKTSNLSVLYCYWRYGKPVYDISYADSGYRYICHHKTDSFQLKKTAYSIYQIFGK